MISITHLRFAGDTLLFLMKMKRIYWTLRILSIASSSCPYWGLIGTKNCLLGTASTEEDFRVLALTWAAATIVGVLTIWVFPQVALLDVMRFGILFWKDAEWSWQSGRTIIFSFGSRITLFKSALSNLLTYYLPLFRILKRVAQLWKNWKQFVWKVGESWQTVRNCLPA